MDTDERFMKSVLGLARKGLGKTSPNPVVGALIVKNGQIIGAGYHHRAGKPHAEIEALSAAGEGARGATLYVNLEPCNHHGRTPPCTEAIIGNGIRRVVVGMADPNPDVTGGGCSFLRAHGLEVKCGVLEEECMRLNEVFLTYVTKGRPFVTVKGALTLDGWMATRTGDSKWITNEKSRRFVHSLRKRADALMVGVETVIADDPFLTPHMMKNPSPEPARVIVDTRLRIPLKSRVLTSGTSALTIVVTGSKVNNAKRESVEELGATVIQCREKNRRVDLTDLLGKLAGMSITSVLIEGGAGVFDTVIRERLVDKFFIFLAPKLLAGDNGVPFIRGPGAEVMMECLTLNIAKVRRFDDDLMIEGYPRR